MYQISSMQEIYGYIYGNNSTIEQTDSFMACCKHLSLQVVSVHARLVASSYMWLQMVWVVMHILSSQGIHLHIMCLQHGNS